MSVIRIFWRHANLQLCCVVHREEILVYIIFLVAVMCIYSYWHDNSVYITNISIFPSLTYILKGKRNAYFTFWYCIYMK
jgi:hypothetical protein